MYDVDDFNQLKNLSIHSLVGEIEFTLHEVVTAKDQIFTKQIAPNKKDAIIEITAEEMQNVGKNDQIIMVPKLEFENNSNKGEMLFFIMYRMHAQMGHPGKGSHIWKPVYKSEIKTNDQKQRNKASFVFNQFSILITDICGNDEDKEVKIEYFRSQKNGRHVNLGQVLFTVEELRNQESHMFKLTKSTGVMTFDKLLIQKKNSFLEYIFGGCELNLAIAIDFTLSNGDPKERDSLHSLNLNNNQYYQALRSVGDILQFYDTDK